jgi:integrase
MKSGNLITTQIRALKSREVPYSCMDGACLSLQVFPSGVKSWRVRYRLCGKAAKITLGRWPYVSLTQARDERDRILAAVHAGISPAEARRRERETALKGLTVREFAEKYLREIVEADRKNPQSIRRYFTRDIFPSIGEKPMQSVCVDDLRFIIFNRRQAGRKQAAVAIRNILKRLWDYAVVCGVAKSNPVHAIPVKYIAHAKARSRALNPAEVGKFINQLQASNLSPMLQAGLRLILLTLTRKTELIHARWEHINLKTREWEIPPENSKNGKGHIVYLSNQACRLFRDLARVYHDTPPKTHYVVHAKMSRTQPVSESTLNRALARIEGNIKHFTVHDLRRTSATLLSEEEAYSADVIEKALNHTLKGVRGVYNRAQYAEKRRTMLQNWADKVEDFTIEQRAAAK